MVNRSDIKKRLMRDFAFYKKDPDYFESILSLNITNYKETATVVLNDLKNSWQNLDVNWFVLKLQNEKKLYLVH